MKMEKNSLLAKAFLEVEQEVLEAYPQEAPISFSPHFEKRMNRLIRAQKRPCWNWTNTVGKRFVAAAVVVFVLFSATMSISAIREPFLELVVEEWEDFLCLFPKNKMTDAPELIETVYVFQKLPEGYVQVSQSLRRGMVVTRWQKGDYKIILDQYPMSTLQFSQDTPIEQETWTVGDYQVIHSVYPDSHMYVWITKQYFYALTCTETFDDQVVMDMIAGLEQ